MSDPLPALVGSLVLSLALTGTLFFAIRAKLAAAWLLLVGMLPPAVVYLWNADVRVYSYHGFMHISIVYQILNGILPPNSPLLGAEPLLYPWGHHLVVAAVVHVLGLSPATIFAWFNILALSLALILIYRSSLLVHAGRKAALFASLLAVFGLTCFNGAPIGYGILDLTGMRVASLRAVVVTKFTNLNSMPLGILCYALFLHAMLRVVAGRSRGRRVCLVLTVAVAGAGFFYPLVWLALPVGSIAIGVALLLRRGGAAWPAIAPLAIGVAAGSLLVLPYLYRIGSGRDAAMLALVPELRVLVLKSLRYGFTLLPLSALAWWRRDDLRGSLRACGDPALALVALLAAGSSMYLLLSWPWGGYAEYKYLLLSCIPLGILAGGLLRDLHSSHPRIAYLIVVGFLIPAGYDWAEKLDRRSWVVSDPYEERGILLHHRDPREDALYRWVASETSPRALFVDSRLTIPVFGRRQLYVGLNTRRERSHPPVRDGWFMDPETLVRQEGHPARILRARSALVREIYAAATPEISAAVVAALRETCAGSDLFVLARDPGTAAKLGRSKAFVKAFETEAAGAYRLRTAAEAAPP